MENANDTTRKSVRSTSKADLKQEGKKIIIKIILYGVFYCLGFSNELHVVAYAWSVNAEIIRYTGT